MMEASETEDEILAHHFDLLQLDGSRRLMVFVDSFFDESGSHQESLFTIVAGFAAFSPDWLPFSVQWGMRLAAHPAISYFHGYEANNRIDQFADWDKTERDDKVISLIEVIRDARPQPLVSAVRTADYQKLLIEFPDTMPEDPYIFCIHNLFLECFHLGEKVRDGMKDAVRVSLNFEDNSAMEKKARFAYDMARKEVPAVAEMLAPTISYLPKKEYRPLQAADALAYDYNKEYTKQERNPKAEMRKSLAAILERIKPIGVYWPWTYDTLKPLFERRYKEFYGGEDATRN